MALEVPGLAPIETPEQARTLGRRWRRMADEISAHATTDAEREKARELRARSEAAYRWARQEEEALAHGREAHDRELAKVTPIRRGEAAPAGGARESARRAARRAGHEAYTRARPAAMRIVHRGRQHFFQGASAPFGPISSGWDLFWEALGASLAVVFLFDLLRAPGAIEAVSAHGLGALRRAVDVRDPITGVSLTSVAGPGSGSRTAPATTAKTHKATA